MLFMCWTRETGVIPAALAGLLLGMKAPGAQMIASVTFIAILMTILIQAPTTDGWDAGSGCWRRVSACQADAESGWDRWGPRAHGGCHSSLGVGGKRGRTGRRIESPTPPARRGAAIAAAGRRRG